MTDLLITGGAGFIGSHLASHLLSEGGWDITIVDDLNDFYSPDIKQANLRAIGSPGDYRFVKADIRASDDLRAIFDETSFDKIVHLAARAGVRPSLLEPKLYTETNVNGTLFFVTADSTSGYALWQSDGTTAGSVRITNINPGGGGSAPSQLTNVNGTLFLVADNGSSGAELWKQVSLTVEGYLPLAAR